MPKFHTSIVGGTFDAIHKGHAALLDAAFEAADEVIIGLSSDEFAASRNKKTRDYADRFADLTSYIQTRYKGKYYEIHLLDSEFGPIATSSRVDALVVSDETHPSAVRLNAERARLGTEPLDIITVPMILAEDGSRISGTRMRKGEIDSDGHVL